jgi:hypothetical protein
LWLAPETRTAPRDAGCRLDGQLASNITSMVRR